MQPTNEQVVAACQRAGIPVELRGLDLCMVHEFDQWLIHADSDMHVGSALFIVAALGAIGEGVEVHRCTRKTWMVVVSNSKERMGLAENTLTVACMAAIVAAFPEVIE